MPFPGTENKSIHADSGEFPGIPANELNPEVKRTDMMPKMLNAAVSVACETLTQTSKPATVAAALKQYFDATYGPTWHCIVGQNFGSNVIHDSRSFAFFTVGGLSVLLFKSGVGN